jgi:hypothetical protein
MELTSEEERRLSIDEPCFFLELEVGGIVGGPIRTTLDRLSRAWADEWAGVRQCPKTNWDDQFEQHWLSRLSVKRSIGFVFAKCST